MSPIEIEELITKTISDTTGTYQISLLLSVILALITTYFFQYFKDKGKNLATKEDIGEITQKIEDVKAEIQNKQEVEKQKRQLKYDALLNSLTLIDAHLSQVLIPQEGQKIIKQYATTEEARQCHNNLILTCENDEVLELFSRIMFGPKEQSTDEEPLTDLLNEYRNLVRKELGFGIELDLDRNRAWFGYGIFEKEEVQEPNKNEETNNLP